MPLPHASASTAPGMAGSDEERLAQAPSSQNPYILMPSHASVHDFFASDPTRAANVCRLLDVFALQRWNLAVEADRAESAGMHPLFPSVLRVASLAAAGGVRSRGGWGVQVNNKTIAHILKDLFKVLGFQGGLKPVKRQRISGDKEDNSLVEGGRRVAEPEEEEFSSASAGEGGAFARGGDDGAECNSYRRDGAVTTASLSYSGADAATGSSVGASAQLLSNLMKAVDLDQPEEALGAGRRWRSTRVLAYPLFAQAAAASEPCQMLSAESI